MIPNSMHSRVDPPRWWHVAVSALTVLGFASAVFGIGCLIRALTR